jgi:hypothetical protein
MYMESLGVLGGLGGSIIVPVFLGVLAVQFKNSRGSVITPRIADAATVAGDPI